MCGCGFRVLCSVLLAVMAQGGETVCILVKTKVGVGPAQVNEGEKSFEFKISEGELVVKLSEDTSKAEYNYYQLVSVPEITFYSPSTDVAPLKRVEFDYLSAVQPPSVRIKEYLKSDELKEKMELVVGDMVMFRMRVEPQLPSVQINGVIRYIGILPERSMEGLFLGIEILVSTSTKHVTCYMYIMVAAGLVRDVPPVCVFSCIIIM